jgi:uncharacterized protein (TIGR00266 family)
MHESTYRYKIINRPDFAFLYIQIPAGEKLMVEAASMATMTPNLKMKTKMKGGFGRLLTKESIFKNEFTAQGSEGEIGIAPAASGDMEHIQLKGNHVFLQGAAYVASTPGVVTESKWQGFVKGFFSGNSMFLIRCSGEGDLWFNTFGAMIEIDVNGEYVVDTGYIVAFTDGLEYSVNSVGGYKSLFLSGEGLVCRFSGQGKVWIQTRQAPAFAGWAQKYRPSGGKGGFLGKILNQLGD